MLSLPDFVKIYDSDDIKIVDKLLTDFVSNIRRRHQCSRLVRLA